MKLKNIAGLAAALIPSFAWSQLPLTLEGAAGEAKDFFKTLQQVQGPGQSSLPPQWEPRKIGESMAMAKDFTLPTVDGKTFTLSQHRGKVVLLDFWASWCPPCRTSTPILIGLHKKYSARGLVVVGVNLEEGRAKVQSFKSQYPGMDYVNTLDNGPVGNLYRVRSIPTFFVVSHDGKIAWTRIGPDAAAMEAAVLAALKAAGK